MLGCGCLWLQALLSTRRVASIQTRLLNLFGRRKHQRRTSIRPSVHPTFTNTPVANCSVPACLPACQLLLLSHHHGKSLPTRTETLPRQTREHQHPRRTKNQWHATWLRHLLEPGRRRSCGTSASGEHIYGPCEYECVEEWEGMWYGGEYSEV